MTGGGALTISTRQEAGGVEVAIADTGGGIPPEVLEKIFQPFYSTKPKGSGLGLAITQKIVGAHHGKITIASEVGKGTRVVFSLPASPPG